MVGNRLDQPHSPAAEAGAAAALQGGHEANVVLKPRRYLLGVWVEGEPGAIYRFLCFCGAHTFLLAELYYAVSFLLKYFEISSSEM